MAQSHLQFDQRVRKLGRKHRALERGYSTKVRPDGLIVMQPRRAPSRMSVIKPLLLLAAAMIVFKAFLLASIGPATYDERLTKLQAGTMPEQAGAWVMQVDPASSYLADWIGPILR